MTRVRTAGCCQRCGAFLRWITMESGKLMPVNPRRDPEGTVAAYPFDRRGRTKYIRGHIITDQHPAGPEAARFRPHFADCRPETERVGMPDGFRDQVERGGQR